MDKLTLAVTLLLASAFMCPVQPAVEQKDAFGQFPQQVKRDIVAQEQQEDTLDQFKLAGAELLSDQELDQVTGAGSFWLSTDFTPDVLNWYSSGISDNAFQYAQGIILPTQVSGNNNSVEVALDLSIVVFNFPDVSALSTFPHLDSLISFP